MHAQTLHSLPHDTLHTLAHWVPAADVSALARTCHAMSSAPPVRATLAAARKATYERLRCRLDADPCVQTACTLPASIEDDECLLLAHLIRIGHAPSLCQLEALGVGLGTEAALRLSLAPTLLLQPSRDCLADTRCS